MYIMYKYNFMANIHLTNWYTFFAVQKWTHKTPNVKLKRNINEFCFFRSDNVEQNSARTGYHCNGERSDKVVSLV